MAPEDFERLLGTLISRRAAITFRDVPGPGGRPAFEMRITTGDHPKARTLAYLSMPSDPLDLQIQQLLRMMDKFDREMGS